MKLTTNSVNEYLKANNIFACNQIQCTETESKIISMINRHIAKHITDIVNMTVEQIKSLNILDIAKSYLLEEKYFLENGGL